MEPVVPRPTPERLPGSKGPGSTPSGPAPTGPAPIRAILAVVGTVSLAIAVVGIVVPILPTTPFLLIAAACYARASTRLYGWLLGQPTLGPIIDRWRTSRTLAPGVKARALVAVVVTFAISIAVVESFEIRLLLVGLAAALLLFLLRIPSTDGTDLS